MLVALFGWLRTEVGELRARQVDRQVELLARVARLEAGQEQRCVGQAELVERVARVEAGQAGAGERMARIDGTVAGALGRPFPGADRFAEASPADAEAPAADG